VAFPTARNKVCSGKNFSTSCRLKRRRTSAEILAMRPFSMTPDLVTEIPAIDQQHSELFNLANEVVDVADRQLDPELFRLTLSFLVGYTVYHFAAEEAVMAVVGYDGRGYHASVHARLRAEVADIVARVQQQGPCEESKADIVLLLEDWIMLHVREADRALARFVRAQAIDVKTLTLPTIASLKSCGAVPADFDDRFVGGLAGLRREQS
jgi:hemerythrin